MPFSRQKNILLLALQNFIDSFIVRTDAEISLHNLLVRGEFPETKISDQLYHFGYKNTTEACNTAKEREFCRLFGDIFENCENLSYEAQFAFFC